MLGNFELLCTVKTDGGIPLSLYKSKQTGMTIVIAEVEGPLVSGYLCLATEAHDDDGLPHTLEHLIFMGSELYPYKGVLDLLANRCLASGTNAWTDVDHTCYTMTTAGHEGFLNLLPIYLDHILYPTLSDSAFVTEIHHINGKGEDAGVVYCEMQGRENTGESRCHLAMLRAMYPDHCGYKSETGGLMKNLRESTTNKKIHEYHKAFYRPENLCVIIAGQVKAEQVFQAIRPVEERIVAKGDRPNFLRPWQSEVPPLPASVDQVISYPCDDDKHGLVSVCWRGPLASNFQEILAVNILMEYLTKTSVSPLQREFVENDDPYCSKVRLGFVENFESCIVLNFENVPKDKLLMLKSRLMEVLNDIVTGNEVIDMKRMATVIHRKKLHILNEIEDSPHEHIAFCVIGYFLYGNTYADLKKRVHQIPLIDGFASDCPEFWLHILKKYCIDGKYVVTVGEPSPNLSDKMTEDEKNRIESQRQRLGDTGLKAAEDLLQKSVAANEDIPPEEMIVSVPVPSAESIKFHTIKRKCNYIDSLNEIQDFPLHNMPCSFQVDSLHSNFITMFVLMDTTYVPQDLRLYLQLLVELLLESPIRKDGEIISHEEVVKQLAADTITSVTSLGLEDSSCFNCGIFAQIAALVLKVEEEKYDEGVRWLHKLLYQTIFTPDRIRVIATKMKNSVAQMKRRGTKITSVMMQNMCYVKESNRWACSLLRQHAFLTNILNQLSYDSEKVIEDLNKVRSLIAFPSNITVHISADVQRLISKNVDLGLPWKCDFLTSEIHPTISRPSVKQCYDLLRAHLSTVTPLGTVAGVGAVESSFLIQTVSSISSFLHPDLPALLVLIQYLIQLEGPMWRQIRGEGLSYHYNISLHPNEGLLFFILYRSTHVVNAYEKAKNIVESHVSGSAKWDLALLESSRSSLMFRMINKERSVAHTSMQSLLSYYKGVDMSYTRELLNLISRVSVDDMKRVGPKYLSPLFDVSVSHCAVCCHPSKVDEVVAGFKEMSRPLCVINNLEDSFLTEL